MDNTLLKKLFLVSKHCIRGSCSLTEVGALLPDLILQ